MVINNDDERASNAEEAREEEYSQRNQQHEHEVTMRNLQQHHQSENEVCVYLEIKEDSDKIIKLLGVETRKSRLCRVVSTILMEENEMVTSGL